MYTLTIFDGHADGFDLQATKVWVYSGMYSQQYDMWVCLNGVQRIWHSNHHSGFTSFPNIFRNSCLGKNYAPKIRDWVFTMFGLTQLLLVI